MHVLFVCVCVGVGSSCICGSALSNAFDLVYGGVNFCSTVALKGKTQNRVAQQGWAFSPAQNIHLKQHRYDGTTVVDFLSDRVWFLGCSDLSKRDHVAQPLLFLPREQTSSLVPPRSWKRHFVVCSCHIGGILGFGVERCRLLGRLDRI